METRQDFPFSERKQRARHQEEHIGLLEEAEDHGEGSQASEYEELDLEESKTTAHRPHRRNWLRTLVVTLLLAWTLGFIIHSFLVPHKSRSASPTTAQLRPEEDYILDPEWDFEAKPITREFHWTIADHELSPDGVRRPMMLINSMFPGPLIESNEGDEIIVHVHNEATNATSIHWHGLFQNGTNWMDGTVGVTQCPIAPGHSFTYRFNVSGQTGTYWYHSHMAMQLSDGLVGPIVIHARGEEEERAQKVPYGQDRVVLVSDHYYDLSSSLLMQYLAPRSENHEPVPHAALINGRGTRNCADLPNRNCSTTNSSNAFFDLSSDYNTRLRIINVGAFAEFQIQIDEHELLLTEVDGVDVYPEQIHRLNLHPAQRYSVVLIPPNPNRGLYWLRARMIKQCFKYEEPDMKDEVRGVMRYWAPGESTEPKSKDWPEINEVECKDLNTSILHPIKAIAAPEKADDQVYLRASFRSGTSRLSRGYFNDSSYHGNVSYPALNAVASTSLSVSTPPFGLNTDIFDPKDALTYQTTGIRVIDILIQNHDVGSHPFHLHGHTFFVLATGAAHMMHPPSDLYDGIDLSNPLRRDTVNVDAMGWTLIRFVADNPGVWAFHCHIGWHSEAGLMMQFVSRADDVAKWKLPREMKRLCAAKGIEKGAPPEDDTWTGS